MPEATVSFVSSPFTTQYNGLVSKVTLAMLLEAAQRVSRFHILSLGFSKHRENAHKVRTHHNSTARRVFYHRETNSHEQSISAERVPTMSPLNCVSPLRELHLIIHMSVNKVNSCHGSSCPKWPFTGRIVSKHMAELPVCVKTHAHSVGTYRIRLGNIR